MQSLGWVKEVGARKKKKEQKKRCDDRSRVREMLWCWLRRWKEMENFGKGIKHRYPGPSPGHWDSRIHIIIYGLLL